MTEVVIHRQIDEVLAGADWLIDNAETYARLLASLHRARRSVHIAQLAFDADCAAYSGTSSEGDSSREELIAEKLIGLAKDDGPEIRILLNATWILNTARPLRKFFETRGVAPHRIEVRGLSRFPHFMHAKLVLIDGREAFLLGSPFVNSYWDDRAHVPIDSRRPLRELGGRPLHDVSVHLRGPLVADLEAMFASVWRSSGGEAGRAPARPSPAEPNMQPAPPLGMRVVCDAPDGILPGATDCAMQMLAELLGGIARARSFIYIEHQYLTSRPIVAALADALRRVPALEILIVINQNPDLTAYRGWQNARLAEHALITHPRVGVFSLWSTDAHPQHAGVTRINQLFIHSKIIVVDDTWAAVGTSNLDGVSLGDYGDDFVGALGRRVFHGVRNVEVNIVMDDAAGSQRGTDFGAHSDGGLRIVELRERLWYEHLAVPRETVHERPSGGWLELWRAAADANVQALRDAKDSTLRGSTTAASAASTAKPAGRMIGRVLPYSMCAFPRHQLRNLGIELDPASLELCYNPTWLSVHTSPYWIRNIF